MSRQMQLISRLSICFRTRCLNVFRFSISFLFFSFFQLFIVQKERRFMISRTNVTSVLTGIVGPLLYVIFGFTGIDTIFSKSCTEIFHC